MRDIPAGKMEKATMVSPLFGLGLKKGYGDGSKPWYLVNPKIAGKWMFIPLKMYL